MQIRFLVLTLVLKTYFFIRVHHEGGDINTNDNDGGGVDDDEVGVGGWKRNGWQMEGLWLHSIIPTIQALSVFLAKGNFIPKDFYI